MGNIFWKRQKILECSLCIVTNMGVGPVKIETRLLSLVKTMCYVILNIMKVRLRSKMKN